MHPEVQDALIEVRERHKDTAESQLMQLIRNGHPSAIIFYLKTMGKDRGYVERVETTGPDGGPVQTKLDLSDLTSEERDALKSLTQKSL